MPGGNDNILFGAEWDGSAVETGVNELVVKLAEAKDAELKLRNEIKETNKEIAFNTAALKANKEALDKATNPADIKKFTDNIKTLSDNEAVLNRNLKQQQTELIVVSKGVNLYNQEVNKLVKNQSLVGNQLEKFTSVNHLAAEGLGLFRRQVVDTGFALISGFAGGLVAQVIPGVVDFVESLVNATDEMSDFERKQAALNDSIDKSGQQYTMAVANVNELRINIQLAKEGFIDKDKVVKEYNSTIGKTTGQVKSLDEAEQALNKNAEAYIQFTLLKAAANIALGEAAKKAFEIEQDRFKRSPLENVDIRRDAFANATAEQIKQFNDLGKEFDKAFFAGNKARADSLEAQQQAMFNTFAEGNVDKKLKDEQKTFLDIANSFQRNAAEIAKNFKFNFFDGKFDEKDTKPAEDAFAQRLKELQARLAEITAKSFQTEGTIRKQFDASLDKEIQSIKDKFQKDLRPSGVPGKTRVEVLVDIATQINEVQQQKSIDDFNRVRTEAEKKVNDAIQQADHEASIKRIENISDEFEREKQLIDERAAGVADVLNKRRDQLIKDLDKTNLTDEEKFLSGTVITSVFKSLTDQNETISIKSQVENSFKAFEAAVKEGNAKFEEELVNVNQDEAAQILAKKKLYEEGKLTYKQFQDSITRILAFAKNERSIILRAELVEQLAAKEAFLKEAKDPAIIAQLEAEIRALKNGIANIDSQVENGEDPNAKRVDNLKKYVAAVGQLLQTIVSFWQQVNAVEAAALDRSISLQEKRVENARDIADKGNAEYLEMEQKRLDELTAKRESNAQKQLAINQALVLSQALLAAVSAIASAAQAPAGTGPFLAIAAGIAVLGAIAAAFSFVNALQPPVATFFKGTESVEGKGHPAGVDTVPARLTIGERVVTAQENKDYYPALTAIHNRKVSPEVLNKFVENVLTEKQKETIRDQKERIIEKPVVMRVAIPGEKTTEVQAETIMQPGQVQKVEPPLTRLQPEKKVSEKVVDKTIVTDLQEKQFTVDNHVITNDQSNDLTREIVNSFAEKIDTRDKNVLIKIEQQLYDKVTRIIDKEYSKAVVPVIMEKLLEKVADNKVSESMNNKEIRVLVSTIVNSFKEKVSHEQTEAKKTDSTINTKEAISEKSVEQSSKVDSVKEVQTATEKANEKSLSEKTIVHEPGEVTKLDVPRGDIQRPVEKLTEKTIETNGKESKDTEKIKEASTLSKELNFFLHDHKEYDKAITAIFNKTVPAESINSFVQSEIEKSSAKEVSKATHSDYYQDRSEGYTYEDYQKEKHSESKSVSSKTEHTEKTVLPSTVVNSFVNTYPGTTVPSVNFDRLADATQGKIGSDSLEVQKKLDTLDKTMNRVVDAVEELAVIVNLDEQGFEASISKYSKKRKLRNRS